jgi:hypothetical protein
MRNHKDINFIIWPETGIMENKFKYS